MKPLWVLTRLRLLEVLRFPSTGLLFFGLPLTLFLMVGLIFANGHPFERRRIALVGGAEPLTGYPELVQQAAPSLEVALNQLRAHQVNGVLARGDSGQRLWVGERDQLLGRAVQALLGPSLTLEVVSSSRWGYVHYVFPGILAFSVIMSGLFGLGYNLVRYRQNLFLRKLATTPLSPATFIAAQMLGRGLLVEAQAVLLLAVAHLAFQLPLTLTGALWTMLILALGLQVSLGVGFTMACLIRTEQLIYDVISALAWPVIMLSEIFFPCDQLPGILPQLAALLPSTQMVRLLRSVLLYGDTRWEALAAGLGSLGIWALIAFAVGHQLFRWND